VIFPSQKLTSVKDTSITLPKFDDLFIPTLHALVALGDSGSVDEINSKVHGLEKISDEVLHVPHEIDGGLKEIDYRLGMVSFLFEKIWPSGKFVTRHLVLVAC